MLGLRIFATILSIICASSAFAAAPFPSADDILKQSAFAIKHSNYQARVTFEHSGLMEVADITHVVVNEKVIEHIRYLNGPERSVITARPIDCEGVGSKIFGGQYISGLDGGISSLSTSYHVNVLGAERVAGRDSWVLRMQPKDQYRHGVILAVDADTYLPTRLLTMSKTRKVLERTHMVSIETPLSEEKISEFAALPNRLEACEEEISESPLLQSKPAWLPPGFVLSATETSARDGFIETYTDGIVAFTVVSKPLDSKNIHPMTTHFTQGATVLVMRVIETDNRHTQVSVLGEIPVETASKILSSVKLK